MQDFFLSRFNSFSLSTNGLTIENLLERSRKDFSYIPNSETLVVALPGAGQNLWSFGLIKAHATHSGASFLAYSFPRQVLSDQAQLTKDCFNLINQTVREDIERLKKQYGFKEVVVAGLSLGTSFASMVANANPAVSKIMMIAPGDSLARCMWHGVRTQHLRRSYQRQGIKLEELDSLWHTLSTENNVPVLEASLSLNFARQDKVIPYRIGRNLVSKLRDKGYKPEVHLYYLIGHYLLSVWFLLFPGFFLKLKKSKRALS